MSGHNLSSFILEDYLDFVIGENHKNLVYLDFSNNSIEYFNIDLSGHEKLKFVNLSYNKLRVFDLKKIPKYVNFLDLSFNQLTDFFNCASNTHISWISLSHNNISVICDKTLFTEFGI
jgi:Leucine-rich repeat (LRR) protein